MFENELDHCLAQMKTAAPKVHCLTNSVAQNLTANALLSIGATPSMTSDAAEVAAFTASADVLLVNLGTLAADRKNAILRAVETANKQNIPWVLDPVLINRAPARRAFAKELLALRPALIRTNPDEMTALDNPLDELLKRTDGVLAITGKVDEVFARNQNANENTDENAKIVQATIKGGHEMMAHVTGLGCAGTAIVAACLAVAERRFEAVCTALHLIGKAGEFAGLHAKGPASFQTLFMDQLYHYHQRGCLDA